MNKKITIIIAAGGTGGHIFPGMAIAKELVKKYHIIWLASVNGMENKLVKDYPIIQVPAVGLRGKNLKHLLIAPFKILIAIFKSRQIILQNNAKLVIVMGGFVGGIGGIASILSRTKFILHEQNSVAGTSNKWLNKLSFKSFQAFDGTLKNAITCGNPINWDNKPRKPISIPLNILVLGGSLGSKVINELVPKLQTKINIVHQTGRQHLTNIKSLYKQSKSIKVVNFINDMADAYALADVVICRSGAMTISELIKTKSIAILIPYPFAIDNHQLMNAKILSTKNCGFLLEEKDLKVEKIDNILNNLNIEKITKMRENFDVFKNINSIGLITKEIDKIFK